MNKLHSEKWFKDRIGKRIYRDADDCECETCKDAVKNGIVIRDKAHAYYLYNIQCDFAIDGTILNYRDEK